jgi:serine protease Do
MKLVKNRFNPLLLGLFFATLNLLLVNSVFAANLPDFTELVPKVSPSVVNISTTQKIKPRRLPAPGPGKEMPDLPEDSPFNDFFRHFFGDENGRPQEHSTQSLGSGFIIDATGYIITNHHVVRDASEIVVRLSDRRELKAKVIGGDPRSDVALLKVEATNLPTLQLGNSENIKAGQWVMAIGSPFGFDHSVSVGVVSAIGRNLPSENYVPFIQTDVAINPGNSGGPLFNLDGEVIGINSQIYTRSGGFMGLSFAIPVNVAMDVVKQLKEKGKVSRGWLGILIQDVNRELAESFGLENPMGAAVLRVIDDSPAATAGFKVGDVVLEFDGKVIRSSSDLPLAVGSTPIGKKAKVKIMREGKPATLTVKIAELPAEDKVEARINEKSTEVNRLGLVADDLSPEQRQSEDLKKGGVVVSKIDSGPAYDAGVRRGDVILKMNNQDVKSIAHFNELVAALPKGKVIPMLIQRRRSPMYLPVKVPND